jgi:cytidylate kinase
MASGIITIDGPAASGKSSVARIVSERLDIPFVSSGLLYRAATHMVLTEGIEPGDEGAVLACLARFDVDLVAEVEGNRILIDGHDRTPQLHTDEIDDAVSAVASHPQLRSWVAQRLREIDGPFVVEGRDMGRVVFPYADHKLFLTAPAEERARRRVGERAADLDGVAEAIRRRDHLDARQLEPAPDARHLDTGGLTLEQVVAAVLAELGAVGVR